MSEITEFMVYCGGVQARLKIELEAPFPPSFESLPNKVMQGRARNAWRAAGKFRTLIDLWGKFLCLGEMRARLDPDFARQIRERFPELGIIDTVLEAIASTVRFPEEVGPWLAEFDRQHGLRRECGNTELQSRPVTLCPQNFRALTNAIEVMLQTEATCLNRLEVNIDQFRRPWQVLRQEIQSFIGSSRLLVGGFHSFGSMQVRIFSRKYSSSRKP